MINIQDVKNIIVEKVYNNVASEFNHNDFILIGSNMTGKSKIIKDIIDTNIDNLYFIDSINRTIPNDNPIGKFSDISSIEDIVVNRRKKDVFNRKDVIDNIHNNNLILNELIENIETYRELINKFFNCEFEVIEKSESQDSLLIGNKIYIYKFGNKKYSSLSNGYQAMIRILMEIKFAVSRGCKFVIIDEIDAHLDNINCSRLISFIKDEFNSLRFLITTHSPDVILSSYDFNIIKINENYCEYYDSNDMNELNYINRTLFRKTNRINNEIENKLTNYIRLLVKGYILTEDDKMYINSIENLSIKQKILQKYILEWND